MTPAEQLAAARERVVGPYLPAKAEWTDPWTGPCEASSVHDWKEGVVLRGGRLLMTYGGRSVDVGFDRCQVRLDVRRPEVRDHLVRLGCPEWARDVPAAVWCWGAGVEVADVVPRWNDAADLAALNAGCIVREPGGWLVPMPDGGIGFFEEVNRDE